MRLSEINIPCRATTIWLCLLLLAGLVFLWTETAKFAHPLVRNAPSAAFFPRCTIAFLLGTVGLLLVREMRLRADAGETAEMPLGGLLIAIVISTIYALLLPYAGFEILTVVFVAGQLAMSYRLSISIAAGVLTMLVIWAVFVIVLQIDLPLLFLPEYL